VLAKMERALEVKLRGKGVGAPLAAGGGKWVMWWSRADRQALVA
jgi:hypothetical protein